MNIFRSDEATPLKLKNAKGLLYYGEKASRRLTNWFVAEVEGQEIWFDVRKVMPLIDMRPPQGIDQILHRMSIETLAAEMLPSLSMEQLRGCGFLKAMDARWN